jgi:hypothetical protein
MAASPAPTRPPDLAEWAKSRLYKIAHPLVLSCPDAGSVSARSKLRGSAADNTGVPPHSLETKWPVMSACGTQRPFNDVRSYVGSWG